MADPLIDEDGQVNERPFGYEPKSSLDEELGTPRSFAVEGNDLSGYDGVSPEYKTYADDRHKPFSGGDDSTSDKKVAPKPPARRGRGSRAK